MLDRGYIGTIKYDRWLAAELGGPIDIFQLSGVAEIISGHLDPFDRIASNHALWITDQKGVTVVGEVGNRHVGNHMMGHMLLVPDGFPVRTAQSLRPPKLRIIAVEIFRGPDHMAIRVVMIVSPVTPRSPRSDYIHRYFGLARSHEGAKMLPF